MFQGTDAVRVNRRSAPQRTARARAAALVAAAGSTLSALSAHAAVTYTWKTAASGNWTTGTGAERRFLAAIHTSACKRFGTVLGPAYNPAHADHLHLELSGRAFCR